MTSSWNSMCQTLVFVTQSCADEPQGLPIWCSSKWVSKSRSLAMATQFTTVIQDL